jgi:coenzyme PQQ precursor peptide PqqA
MNLVHGTRCQGFHRNPKETLMQWSHPAFEDMRFGFEITMYISNR